MPTTTIPTEADILNRVISPEKPGLSAEAAQSILSLAFGEQDVACMNELSAKANQGTLTAAEQELLNNYERVGHLLAILQSKARLSLKTTAANT